MKSKIKGVVGESSIVLHYEGEAVTIQSATDRLLFEEFKDLIKTGQTELLLTKFLDVRARIEKYTDKNFYIKNQQLYLKGDETPIPADISKKLLELEASGEDFMPLVRFWKKLKSNESQESIKQLYGFIEHNKIPLTEMGDIVTEKGVKQRSGAPVGELVDDRTGAIDNSLGMEVFMDRKDVDENPNQTCSHGLHVAAPEYVQKFYSGGVIIQCIVNPRDVVAVPTDYNNTKMRVCRYVVAGYSDKATYKPVYKFSDFVQTPSEEVKVSMELLLSKPVNTLNEDKKVKSVKVAKNKVNNKLLEKYNKKFNEMTGKAIIEFMAKRYGITFTHNPKSKTAIVKKAAVIAANSEEINKK